MLVMCPVTYSINIRSLSTLQTLPPIRKSGSVAGSMFTAAELNGLAVRVPLLNASLTDAVFQLARDVTAEEVNERLRAAADGELAP